MENALPVNRQGLHRDTQLDFWAHPLFVYQSARRVTMGSAASIALDSSAVMAAVDELPSKRQRGYGKKLPFPHRAESSRAAQS